MVGRSFLTTSAIGTTPENITQLQSLKDSELQALAAEYPYVALYKTLLARRYKATGNRQYRELLRQAALQAPDRVRLYELLNHEEAVTDGMSAVEDVVQEPPAQVDKITTADEPHPEEPQPAVDESVPAAEQEAKNSEEEMTEAAAARGSETDIEAEAQAPEEHQVEDAVPAAAHDEVPMKERPADEILRTAARRDVSPDEKHTFLEWLELLDGPGVRKAPTEEPAAILPGISDEDAVGALEDQIDEYSAASQYEADIQREVSDMETHDLEADIDPDDSAAVKDLADKSIAMHTGAVTETLAKLMLMQGKKSEAIAMYEQLRLKYPEKSDYFAAQITALQTS